MIRPLAIAIAILVGISVGLSLAELLRPLLVEISPPPAITYHLPAPEMVTEVYLLVPDSCTTTQMVPRKPHSKIEVREQ